MGAAFPSQLPLGLKYVGTLYLLGCKPLPRSFILELTHDSLVVITNTVIDRNSWRPNNILKLEMTLMET